METRKILTHTTAYILGIITAGILVWIFRYWVAVVIIYLILKG